MFVLIVHGEEVPWELEPGMKLALDFRPIARDLGKDCMVGIPSDNWNREISWFKLPMQAHELEAVFS